MNTFIAGQAREIAVLGALGARRRQIGRITGRTAAMPGRTAAMPGLAGALAGTAVGYLLAQYCAGRIGGVPSGFGVPVPVIVASVAAAPVLAALAGHTMCITFVTVGELMKWRVLRS